MMCEAYATRGVCRGVGGGWMCGCVRAETLRDQALYVDLRMLLDDTQGHRVFDVFLSKKIPAHAHSVALSHTLCIAHECYASNTCTPMTPRRRPHVTLM